MPTAWLELGKPGAWKSVFVFAEPLLPGFADLFPKIGKLRGFAPPRFGAFRSQSQK
jgi:hypothetical protein